MKKFRYRMEPLLKMREHLEKEKQKILAAAQNKILRQREELRQIDSNRQITMDQQENKTTKPFSVAEMLVYSRYIHKLKRERMVGDEMMKVLKKDEIEKRKALLEAARERKKYETLKEKQTEKYYKEMTKLENKESDETALNIFRLNKSKKKSD